MTPSLVATSALINFDHPNLAASGLPNVANPATDAYGAYAAGVWLKALSPTLGRQSWTWTPPSAAVGEAVPSVIGMDLAAAKARLASSGFKMALVDPELPTLLCPSTVPLNMIAFAGPQIAPKGTTITVCPSAGVSQTIFVPPKPKPIPIPIPVPVSKPKPTPTPIPIPIPKPSKTRPRHGAG